MKTAFEEVMAIRAKGMPATGEGRIAGRDPVLPTRFKIGEVCAAVIAGIGVAVSDVWELRAGRRQDSSVDVRWAAAALGSANHMRRRDPNGVFSPVVSAEQLAMHAITQPWPTRDGRWFLPHFALPNLRDRVLGLLGCNPDPESVKSAVAKWDALDLEAAIDAARACGAMVRTNDEWLDHPHGQTLAAKPIVEIIKIADSEPLPLPGGDRPLDGIRALDLTRILAGPIAARTLAEHGADVLMVTAKRLPLIPEHVTDTSHGKRSCFLDLSDPAQAGKLRELVSTADVFSGGYRPGMLESLGFGPQDLAALRPGLIYASISCFGADGALSHRAGWEQVAQTVTGICHEGQPDRPALLPAAACDYTTGYLTAYGILLALARRATEGGSYHVRVSLCQSGMFIYRQGKTGKLGQHSSLAEDDLDAMRIESHPAGGPLRHLGPILALAETPPRWARPTPVLGGDQPQWLENPAGVAAAE